MRQPLQPGEPGDDHIEMGHLSPPFTCIARIFQEHAQGFDYDAVATVCVMLYPPGRGLPVAEEYATPTPPAM